MTPRGKAGATSSAERLLHLTINPLYGGSHRAAWQAPYVAPFASFGLAYWLEVARLAEAGGLDAVFVADSPSFFEPPETDPPLAFDPTVLLAAVASNTERVGLIATVSTSYEEPFNVARRIATLDQLSAGRAAWNVVTTADPNAARNFSREPLDKQLRYARAEEFVRVVEALWDSWDDEALVGDQVNGVFADGAHVHRIGHRGAHFSVEGPLTLPRSPQGRPVIIQAGSSEAGRDLAAATADAIFTAQATLEDSAAFARDVRRRAAAQGRDPDAIRILPGLGTVIGGTEAEARARHEELNTLAGPRRLEGLAGQIGADPEELDLDRPLPERILRASGPTVGAQGGRDVVLNLARRERLTVRELLERVILWQGLVVGTPEQVADRIEEWFRAGAADGFNLMPDVVPSGLEALVEHVLPLLRRRGIFRGDYSGRTLRDHLGLARPPSRRAEVRLGQDGAGSR